MNNSKSNLYSKHRRERNALYANGATPFGVALLRKSVLCILSDASVRKYVPVRHEHKGEIIEEVITEKYRLTISKTN